MCVTDIRQLGEVVPSDVNVRHGHVSEVMTVGRSGLALIEATPDQQGIGGRPRRVQVTRLALRVQSRGRHRRLHHRGRTPLPTVRSGDFTKAGPTPRQGRGEGYLPVPRRMPLASSTCRLAAVDW